MNVEQLKDSKSEMLYSTSELSKLKYVKRNEKLNGVKRYAFHYTNATPENIDAICKYVTAEQIEQLKAMQKVVK